MKELIKDTRAVLAIYWSLVATLLLFYITVKFGDRVEILTLIIGIISGSIIGGIFGVYFNGSIAKKGQDVTTSTTTDNSQTTTTTNV